MADLQLNSQTPNTHECRSLLFSLDHGKAAPPFDQSKVALYGYLDVKGWNFALN